MNFRERKESGFTLIELIVVIFLLGSLTAITAPLVHKVRSRNAFAAAVATTKQLVRQAQILSRAGTGATDSGWGVKIEPGRLTLFHGGSYAARVASLDDEFSVDPRVNFAGTLGEVVFARLSGEPVATGDVEISHQFTNQQETLIINPAGVVL